MKIGQKTFYKCPLWYFEGEILRPIHSSSYEVKITKIHYNKSKYRKLELGQLVFFSKDELDKIVVDYK